MTRVEVYTTPMCSYCVAAKRLLDRVQRVEAAAGAVGRRPVDLTPAELDRLWRDAKRRG